MEKITITDGALTVELQRWLNVSLYGNEKHDGLYALMGKGLPNFESYQRMVGTIQAYEAVLRQMNAIANERGSEMEEKVVFSRPGLNS